VSLLISPGRGLLNKGRLRPVRFSGSQFGDKAHCRVQNKVLEESLEGPASITDVLKWLGL
jgi:hypothetical protein